MRHAGGISCARNLVKKMTHFSHLASAYLFYPAILVLIFADVCLRWMFNHPLAWSLETSCLLLVPAVLLAAGKVEMEDAHIKLDIIYPKLGTRGKYTIDLLGSACALLWSAAMTWRGAQEVVTSYQVLEGGAVTPVPYWPFRVLFLVAFLLLSLVVLNNIAGILQKRPGVTHA